MWLLDLAEDAVFSRQEPPSAPQEPLLPAVASCPWGPPHPTSLPGRAAPRSRTAFPRCLFMLSGKILVNSHPLVLCLAQRSLREPLFHCKETCFACASSVAGMHPGLERQPLLCVQTMREAYTHGLEPCPG